MSEVRKCFHADLCKKYYKISGRVADECTHKDAQECPVYWKIEDILQETIPFYDPDEDLPEEDEEEP